MTSWSIENCKACTYIADFLIDQDVSAEFYVTNNCRSTIMPLFSSSSPFDQDVGKFKSTSFSSLFDKQSEWLSCLFLVHRESDKWTQHNGRLAAYYGIMWSYSSDTIWVCRLSIENLNKLSFHESCCKSPLYFTLKFILNVFLISFFILLRIVKVGLELRNC